MAYNEFIGQVIFKIEATDAGLTLWKPKKTYRAKFSTYSDFQSMTGRAFGRWRFFRVATCIALGAITRNPYQTAIS